jgi:hypothetical protein
LANRNPRLPSHIPVPTQSHLTWHSGTKAPFWFNWRYCIRRNPVINIFKKIIFYCTCKIAIVHTGGPLARGDCKYLLVSFKLEPESVMSMLLVALAVIDLAITTQGKTLLKGIVSRDIFICKI